MTCSSMRGEVILFHIDVQSAMNAAQIETHDSTLLHWIHCVTHVTLLFMVILHFPTKGWLVLAGWHCSNVTAIWEEREVICNWGHILKTYCSNKCWISIQCWYLYPFGIKYCAKIIWTDIQIIIYYIIVSFDTL